MWLGKMIYSYKGAYDKAGHDCGMLEALVKQVIVCGAVPIKFCQWIIPNLELLYIDENELYDLKYDKPAWIKKLEVVFDGCPEHSLRYTYGEYRTQFGHSLTDDYQIQECIGSGSIGQVYKVRDIKTDNELVMKVRHPYVEEQIWLFDWLFRIMNRIVCWYLGVHHWIPFNIPSFIDGFNVQSDFIQEANHLLRMQHLFADNWAIRIPELAMVSESILVMEYVDGMSYEDLQEVSDTQKTKIFSVFYLFTRETMMVHNFNHGDLHRSNWKVVKSDNPMGYQVVLYDFGYCWSVPSVKMHIVLRIIELFETTSCEKSDKDTRNIADILFETIEHPHIRDKRTLREDILTYLNESPYVGKSEKGVSVTPAMIYRVCSGFCTQKSLLIHPILIQFVILYTQIQKNCAQNGFSSITGFTERSFVYKERYLHCLNICKTYNIFRKYQVFLEDKLNEIQIERTSVFDFIGIPKELKAFALEDPS